MAVLDGIETRRQKEKDTIEREGVIRGKQWANERLAIATKSFDDEVASYKRTREILARINKDWNNGAKESYKNYLDGINNVAKDTEKMFDKAFQGMEDIMVNFVKTGKLDFKSLADSIISDLIRIEVRQSMMKGMSSAMMGGGSWLASLFNANGNAFTSSGVQGFADGGAFHNSVLTRTTPFMFASGGGFSQAIAGEAGPEAVMPLTRGANGKLGVQSSGGGGNTVTVNIIESPGNGGTQNRRTENGTDVLDVFVEKVKNSIAGDISKGSGSVPSAMSQTYGLNRVAGAY
jgi:lambda family phage tail tape measure protein